MCSRQRKCSDKSRSRNGDLYEYYEFDCRGTRQKNKSKEISVEEAVTAALDAIEKKEKLVNSFVTVDREGALKRAKEVQKQIDDGTLTGPLAGVPVAIKDNMCTKDLLTTCSSKILYNFIPTYTAEAVLNLEKQGQLF